MGHVIAIDGPAGAGKSTIARRLAEKLGYVYIDSGAMYRAVALWAIRENIDPDDAHRVEQLARAADIELLPMRVVHLNSEDVSDAIRIPEVSAAASRVAAIGAVRAALVAKQKRMADRANVVMEGRDIGTVVFPDARVKIFWTPIHWNGYGGVSASSPMFRRRRWRRRFHSATHATGSARSHLWCRRPTPSISIPPASRRTKSKKKS